jgi:hypothetical protein
MTFKFNITRLNIFLVIDIVTYWLSVMSVNILAATNAGNNGRTAVSMRQPINTFPLVNMTTTRNPLLYDTRQLLGYAAMLNRCFLCDPCLGYITRAVSCGYPPWRLGFEPRSDHVGLVNKVALG